jgi:16S rRNA (guanine1516-N2)-methyltransferase
MAALLHDALQRAAIAPALSAIVPQQLQLIQIDACTFLQQLNPQAYPDVILCDPMHPNRSKTALVKKDMRILQTIVGQDIDASELLQLALIKAKKRVVVKRPRHAPPLWPNPTMVHSYTSSRFDIYLTKNRPI